MKHKWILSLAMVLMGATVVLAGWQVVSDVTAGGGAKELAVNRSVQSVLIKCTSGTVIINTVVIREGGAKNPITVARKFNAGEQQELNLGGTKQVTGLRISDSGRGTYQVSTQ